MHRHRAPFKVFSSVKIFVSKTIIVELVTRNASIIGNIRISVVITCVTEVKNRRPASEMNNPARTTL